MLVLETEFRSLCLQSKNPLTEPSPGHELFLLTLEYKNLVNTGDISQFRSAATQTVSENVRSDHHTRPESIKPWLHLFVQNMIY